MRSQRETEKENIPAILEPDLDLLGFDVGENRAFANELLAAHGARFRALSVHSLERIHLLCSIADVLSAVHRAPFTAIFPLS